MEWFLLARRVGGLSAEQQSASAQDPADDWHGGIQQEVLIDHLAPAL
ncbi:MAG: hypothetical protein ACI87W_003074 [Halieaceae bacterium]|jgi:hypothetical protein